MTRWRGLLPALLLVGCACALYARSLPGPFVFDDVPSLVDNANLRALWPIARVFQSPGQTSIAGRPVASLSFALSYAAFGTDPRGWRAVNVALHAACGLLLLGWARRALARTRFADRASPLALAIALLWLVHPLATEAVAYLTQRTELLMATGFLGSFYALERGFEREQSGDPPWRWWGVAIAALWLGAGAKEVIVAAPPLLFLYDRAFVSGSTTRAWRHHRALHLGLFSSWFAVAIAVASGPRDETVGFGLPISAWQYALTQLGVVAWYLRLALWPAPLVIAHDWPVARGLADVWPGLLVVVPLALATLWACISRPRLGFLGAWFFAILAPTSSFVPIISEIAAERRMYLPLIAGVAGTVLGVYGLLRARAPRFVPLALTAAAALALVTVSAFRLELYRSPLALWSQVIAIYPEHRMRDQMESAIGQELAREGQLDAALPHFEKATELRPEVAKNWSNLGRARLMQNRLDPAVTAFARASELAPDDSTNHANLGLVLAKQNRWMEAEDELERALVLDTGNQVARKALARVLVRRGEALVMDGQFASAVPHFQRAVQLDPGFDAAQQDLVETLMKLQRPAGTPPVGNGLRTPS